MAFSSAFAFSVKRFKPELVVPAKPTPREIKKLSDIDDQEGLRSQVPIVFFYKNNPSMQGINPVEVIRGGLAKTLVYYYPFAGRIMEGDNRKLIVDCNGEGVLFVEADAYIRLEQLGDNIFPPCPFMEEFLHDVPGSGGIIGCPLLLIQPELVVPAKPTPREIKKLSDIDDQEGLRFQVPIVFFYKNNPSMQGINPVEVIREGLAKTLVYYYPFAGRIMEGDNRKLMVDCNGEGVLFVGADAYIRLEQLGDNIFPPCPFLEEFLHDVPGSGGIIGYPLLLIQVTRFICGGFALGIRFNHTMADGYGIMQFLNSISELMKGASAPSILPVWQREQCFNARSPPRITCIHHEYEQIPQSIDFMDSDKLIRTAIFFTPKVIQALYNNISLSGSFRRCSRFDLIIACLWKCRTNALNPSDPDETVRLSVLTNVRGKPSLNIPAGYYGNAFVYPAAVSTARILCTAPLSYAVQLIQKAKAQMSEEYIKSVADLMVIKKRPKYATGLNFIVSDITRLGFEKIDLGWGNAVYGGVASATSNISFCTNFKNSKGEDGVVVPVCLPPLAVEKFNYELEKMTCEPLCRM